MPGVRQGSEDDWTAKSPVEFADLCGQIEVESGSTAANLKTLLELVNKNGYAAVGFHNQRLALHPNTLYFPFTCASCGGSGNYTCSCCGGIGKSTCSTCGGGGSQNCTSCGGVGFQNQYVTEYDPVSQRTIGRNKSVRCYCGSGRVTCAACGGQGTILCMVCGGTGSRTCHNCAGTGVITYVASGETLVNSSSSIVIPPDTPGWVTKILNDASGQTRFLEFGHEQSHSDSASSGIGQIISESVFFVPFSTVSLMLNGHQCEVHLMGNTPAVVAANNLFELLLENDLTAVESSSKGTWIYPYKKDRVSQSLTDYFQSEVNLLLATNLSNGETAHQASLAVQGSLGEAYAQRTDKVLSRITWWSVVCARFNIIFLASLLTPVFALISAVLIAKGDEHRLPHDATGIEVLATTWGDLVLIAITGCLLSLLTTGLGSVLHRSWLHKVGGDVLLNLAKKNKRVVGKWSAVMSLLCATGVSVAIFGSYPIRAAESGELFGIQHVIPYTPNRGFMIS